LERVQAQAEQRVHLGAQLFKAAEAHTSQYRDSLSQVKADQDKLRSEVQEDVSRSLHSYDQWIGQMEEDFTSAITSLEAKMDKLQSDWASAQQRIERMMKRSEAMLDQSRTLLESGNSKATPHPDEAAEEPFDAVAPAAVAEAAHELPEIVAEVVDETPDFYRQALSKLREQEREQENPAA
jgi:flagellar biosynthesis chaperone FliJ